MSTDMGKIRDKERQLLEREIIFGEPVIGLEVGVVIDFYPRHQVIVLTLLVVVAW